MTSIVAAQNYRISIKKAFQNSSTFRARVTKLQQVKKKKLFREVSISPRFLNKLSFIPFGDDFNDLSACNCIVRAFYLTCSLNVKQITLQSDGIASINS